MTRSHGHGGVMAQDDDSGLVWTGLGGQLMPVSAAFFVVATEESSFTLQDILVARVQSRVNQRFVTVWYGFCHCAGSSCPCCGLGTRRFVTCLVWALAAANQWQWVVNLEWCTGILHSFLPLIDFSPPPPPITALAHSETCSAYC